MKRHLIVAAAIAALLTAGGGAALAQTPTPVPPTCSQALGLLNAAQSASDAAFAADKAAIDARAADAAAKAAKDADDAVITAQAKLDAALPVVLTFNANVYPGDTVPANVAALTPTVLRQILADTDLGGDARALVQAALDAHIALAAAITLADKTDAGKLLTEANKTNADELAAEAIKTDAAKLAEALAKAKAAADKACTGATGSPGTPGATGTPGPSGAPGRPGTVIIQQVPVVPNAAPNTGGGPA